MPADFLVFAFILNHGETCFNLESQNFDFITKDKCAVVDNKWQWLALYTELLARILGPNKN